MNLFKKGWKVTEDPEDEPQMSRQEILEKAAKRQEKHHEKALEDTFPASDPPASNVFD